MNRPAIEINNLGKEYLLGGAEHHQENFRDAIIGAFTAPLRKLKRLSGKDKQQERFWALKDVSFDVMPGEVVGIIGRNGAGKSTLLKILSRITEPTEGRAITRGRIASLLEVGTGFHPELTGRENVFLNGAILGMKRAEIKRKFDEIVDFANVSKFVDTPVKRYSSGMYVRLAFAVAAHVELEILIVDEVLAVGDTYFQRKCLGKMEEVSSEGRTVLFVSHNMSTIRSLCKRAILLNRGQVELDADAVDTVNTYLDQEHANAKTVVSLEKSLDVPAQIVKVGVYNQSGLASAYHPHDEPLVIEICIAVYEELPGCYIAFQLLDQESRIVLFSRYFVTPDDSVNYWPPGNYRVRANIPAPLLVPGAYYVTVHLMGTTPPLKIDGVDGRCRFEVVDAGSSYAKAGMPWHGYIATPVGWEMDTLN